MVAKCFNVFDDVRRPAMQRYFFHYRRDGDIYQLDEEGTVLPDLEAVRDEALASARELMKEGIPGREADGSMFEIEDERGARVMTVPFREALN
jgi:hypothetical protein